MEKAPPRPSISPVKRARIFQREGGVCYLCRIKIAAGEPWDADHANQRAISHDDSEQNLFPAHVLCHREKTKSDAKARAKVNRIVKKASAPRKESRLKSRGFNRTLTRKFSGEVVSRKP